MTAMPAPRWKPSVTVAAVIEQHGRYLLVEERTLEGLRLNNPAGHLDPGESLLEAVARETLEETACAFVPQALVGVYMVRMQRPPVGGGDAEDVTYLRFTFCGEVGPPDPSRSLDEPVVRTLWMTPEEIHASRDRHRSPLLLRCVEDHRAGRRYPLDLLQADPSVWLGAAG
jgi:8-oxo-dGTP pyrophosphatase MutT (NUDIX family)